MALLNYHEVCDGGCGAGLARGMHMGEAHGRARARR